MNNRYINHIINEEVSRFLYEFTKRRDNSIMEFGPTSKTKKRKYAHTIWDKLQQAYAYCGGCQSFDDKNGDGGFNDFVDSPYIWRVCFGNGSQNIKGCIIYKPTTFGRKKIASFADSRETYALMTNYDMNPYNHVYGEVSGKSERMLQKDDRTNWISNQQAPTVLRKQIDLDADPTINANEKIPYNPDIHYYRKIGDTKHRKALWGHPQTKNNTNNDRWNKK